METTKNKLSENAEKFFQELSNYLETPLYFYGSIQRNDYFPGHSDIDVDIFTHNEFSVITKMQHFLHVKRCDFKKFIWRLNENNKMIYGYKIMYKNAESGINAEFSIYNEKIKYYILREHNNKMVMPFCTSWLLILLKTFYYNLNLIDKKTFRYLKKKLLTFGLGFPDDDFVVIDPK